MTKEFGLYHVSLKILLKKGAEFLFLVDQKGKCLDLPGGRIDTVEHEVPLTAILEREVTEELGNDVHYSVGKPLFQFRRHFPHRSWHVLCTVYAADYISGNLKLSDEHGSFKWINPAKYTFKEDEFFNKEEFGVFTEYFASH